MRLQCYFCGKSVSNELPEETVVRALLICPECVEARYYEMIARVTSKVSGEASDEAAPVEGKA
jgi:hypothetical protein